MSADFAEYSKEAEKAMIKLIHYFQETKEVNDYGYSQRKGTQRPYISKAKPHY